MDPAARISRKCRSPRAGPVLFDTGDLRDIVLELHGAITSNQRIDALSRLNQMLVTRSTGNPSLLVVYLIEDGIIPVLISQLNNILQRMESCPEQIALVLQLIDTVFRHCPRHLQQGLSLEMNVDFFDLCSSEILVSTRSDIYADSSSQLSFMSILHSTSGSAVGTEQIVKSRITLMRVIGVMNDMNTSDECLYEVLGLLKNLSYYAQEQRSYLIGLPGFLGGLSTIASRTFLEKLLERLSAILRNLTVSSDCRVQLARSTEVLGALTRMASLPNKTVLRNVINTLISLSMNYESCFSIIQYGDGMILTIVKRLIRSHPDDAVIRKRVTRILRLLSNEETCPFLIQDRDLIPLLSKLAFHDQNEDVRFEASGAFAKCASVYTVDRPQYAAILDGLVILAQSHSVPAEVLAQALREQTRSSQNCKLIIERHMLIDSIVDIAVSPLTSSTAKDDACCALWHLSSEGHNQERLLMSSSILSALVANASSNSVPVNDSASRQEHSILALVELAKLPANRKKMLSHGNLLQVMIQFAATTPDMEAKDKVKKVILLLVQEV